MEEGGGRELVTMKHVCKFCSKSFPCGRSLGGHMRSHITNNNVSPLKAEAAAKKKKIESAAVVNGGAGGGSCSSKVLGEYDLRENPKKSWRFSDSRNEEEEETDSIVIVTEDEKFCKECGKSFQSWKALFGHMKCHSEKSSINNLENRDSVASGNKVVTDNQSDNEGTGNNSSNPNRRRRSKRRRTRFVTSASTNSSVSEVEQEQEEVAISLMMLSRDASNWGGFNSLIESSDNNSANFEVRSSYVVPPNLSTKIDSENLDSKGKKIAPVSLATVVSINGTEQDSSVRSNWKRPGKFKCTTCNKIFHSYQALGGHRSSHKKLKGGCCSAIRNYQSSENSIETDLNNELITGSVNFENEEEILKLKNNKVHECPICLKIFPSGQALGGHKRSHFDEKPVKEIRDFLDLNLPASGEEESNNSLVMANNYPPWWVLQGHNHHHHHPKQEPLVGLISN